MLIDPERRRAAGLLTDAERDARPIDSLSARTPGLDLDDAWAIARLGVADRVAAGARVRGYRVGLATPVARRAVGAEEPVLGQLLDSMIVAEGSVVHRSMLCAPRVEAGLALVLGAPLEGPGCTVADVTRATEFVLPALELVDSRVRDGEASLEDLVADNAGAGRLVLGGRPARLGDLDPALVGVVLRLGGEVVATGCSGLALGNPLAAVAWLANRLAVVATGPAPGLEAGSVVVSGSCLGSGSASGSVSLGTSPSARADFDGLGHVSVRLS